jgi:hypothetical protein
MKKGSWSIKRKDCPISSSSQTVTEMSSYPKTRKERSQGPVDT